MYQPQGSSVAYVICTFVDISFFVFKDSLVFVSVPYRGINRLSYLITYMYVGYHVLIYCLLYALFMCVSLTFAGKYEMSLT